MGEVIVITSGKGGVGKTTVTVGLGMGLARRGKKVVLVDADIGLRHLDVALGLENGIVHDLVDVIEAKCLLQQALVKDRRQDGLYLLPAAQTRDKKAVMPSQMQELCRELAREFDYVLIDSPPGIEQGFYNAIAGADKALIVTTPDMASVRAADRVMGLLASAGKSDTQLIVNRYREPRAGTEGIVAMDDIVEIVATEVLGRIPADEAVVYLGGGKTIIDEPLTAAGVACTDIVRRILGEKIPCATASVPSEGGLWSKIKKHLS